MAQRLQAVPSKGIAQAAAFVAADEPAMLQRLMSIEEMEPPANRHIFTASAIISSTTIDEEASDSDSSAAYGCVAPLPAPRLQRLRPLPAALPHAQQTVTGEATTSQSTPAPPTIVPPVNALQDPMRPSGEDGGLVSELGNMVRQLSHRLSNQQDPTASSTEGAAQRISSPTMKAVEEEERLPRVDA